jgi:PAS domain-containing protein
LYSFIAIIASLSIFIWKIFPACYIEGQGMTPFKIYSEYIIIAIFLSSIIFVWSKKKYFDKTVIYLIIASLFLQVLTEVFYTQYLSAFLLANMFGHIIRLFAVYLIYWAIVIIGLEEPLTMMVNKLKVSEEKYNAIVNNMNNAIVVYKPIENGKDFVIINFNQAAEKIDKIKKDKILNKKLSEAFPGVKKMGLFEVLQRVNKTGKSEHFDVSFYSDKRISGWRENYIYRLSSGEIIVSYSDVTAQKQAEEQLIKRTAEVERFNNLMVGREVKMAEMKRKMDEFKRNNPEFKA